MTETLVAFLLVSISTLVTIRKIEGPNANISGVFFDLVNGEESK